MFIPLVPRKSTADFTLQSLPNSNYEGVRIPLGIKSAAGKTVSLSVNVDNLPTGLEVYLEYKLLGKEVNLTESKNRL